MQDASTCDRNPGNLTSIRYITPELSSFSELQKDFFTKTILQIHFQQQGMFKSWEELLRFSLHGNLRILHQRAQHMMMAETQCQWRLVTRICYYQAKNLSDGRYLFINFCEAHSEKNNLFYVYSAKSYIFIHAVLFNLIKDSLIHRI